MNLKMNYQNINQNYMNEESNIPESLWEDINKNSSVCEYIEQEDVINLEVLKDILDKYFSQYDKFY